MHRQGSFRPLGTGEGWGFLPWTQAMSSAMLTTPASYLFGVFGNLIPVFWVTLAINGHEPGIELEPKSGLVSITYTTWPVRHPLTLDRSQDPKLATDNHFGEMGVEKSNSHNPFGLGDTAWF